MLHDLHGTILYPQGHHLTIPINYDAKMDYSVKHRVSSGDILKKSCPPDQGNILHYYIHAAKKRRTLLSSNKNPGIFKRIVSIEVKVMTL